MAEHVRRDSQRPSAGVAVVGVIGEILITIAVVLALYAVWELYWTSYEVEAPRAATVQQFAEEHAPTSRKLGEVRTDAPPAFTQNPADGEVYGLLHIPSWNWMKTPLAEGTSEAVLNLGYAGHYDQSAQPGELGNFSVAGHRRTYGNNFRHIDKLVPGDKVVVESDDIYYVYRVESHEIVEADDPTNIRVVAPVPGDLTFSKTPTQRYMTMTTCNPEYGNSQRYIVHLIFESWTPKSTGVPAELVDEPTS